MVVNSVGQHFSRTLSQHSGRHAWQQHSEARYFSQA